jgi:hypothetical protein
VAVLFTLTLPGLVILLVSVAAVERFGRWFGRSWLPWRRSTRAHISAGGFDELTACFYAGKRIELEQRTVHQVLAIDDHDGAPPAMATPSASVVMTLDPTGRPIVVRSA